MLLERLGRRSCLAVPIMLGDVAWGELWASRGPDQADFDEHDLRLLDAIAGQVAAGVGRAELFGRMAELALQDGLTGLANRRALEERLGLALEEAGKTTRSRSCCATSTTSRSSTTSAATTAATGRSRRWRARCARRPRRCRRRSCAG